MNNLSLFVAEQLSKAACLKIYVFPAETRTRLFW